MQIIETSGPLNKLRMLKSKLKEKYPQGFLCETTVEHDGFGAPQYRKLILTLPGAYTEDMQAFLDDLSNRDIIYLFNGYDAITRVTTAWRDTYTPDLTPPAISVVTSGDSRIGQPVRKVARPWFSGKIAAINTIRGVESYVIMNDAGIGYASLANRDIMAVTEE